MGLAETSPQADGRLAALRNGLHALGMHRGAQDRDRDTLGHDRCGIDDGALLKSTRGGVSKLSLLRSPLERGRQMGLHGARVKVRVGDG